MAKLGTALTALSGGSKGAQADVHRAGSTGYAKSDHDRVWRDWETYYSFDPRNGSYLVYVNACLACLPLLPYVCWQAPAVACRLACTNVLGCTHAS